MYFTNVESAVYRAIASAIGAEALNRLQKSSEWEQTQRAIAQHWFSSVEHIQSPQLGLPVLEAYYHFREIEDYD